MLTKNHFQGMTLIELLLALVIAGLLLMFALPNYSAWINNSQIRTAAESILDGMQLARAEAVRQNTNVQFALTSTASPKMSDWTVSVVSLLPAASAVVQTRSSAEGSATARVASVYSAGSPPVITPTPNKTIVTFTSLGRVYTDASGNLINPIDGSAELTEVDVTSTSAAANRPLNVRVNGGMVRMCDPGIPAANPQSCSY